jgi:hypothetical protein
LDAAGGEVFEIGEVEHVEALEGGMLADFVVAAAGVDEDDFAAGEDEPALHARHQAARCVVEELRLREQGVLGEDGGVVVGVEESGVEAGAEHFLDPSYLDVADFCSPHVLQCSVHLGAKRIKVFWFFFSKKNSSSFLKKRSKKLLSVGGTAFMTGMCP